MKTVDTNRLLTITTACCSLTHSPNQTSTHTHTCARLLPPSHSLPLCLAGHPVHATHGLLLVVSLGCVCIVTARVMHINAVYSCIMAQRRGGVPGLRRVEVHNSERQSNRPKIPHGKLTFSLLLPLPRVCRVQGCRCTPRGRKHLARVCPL